MSAEFDEVYLDLDREAERLWQGAQDAIRGARQDLVRLSESVDFGVRVVEIMTTRRLQPLATEFPATITGLLKSPPPEIDPQRDLLAPQKALRFVDALDMLSASDLPCISPQLHHGWEDRAVSCQRSRARTNKATGIAVDAEQRDALMLIGAYRNRLFFLPPPVRIFPEDIVRAFPSLVDLVERLFASPTTREDHSSTN